MTEPNKESISGWFRSLQANICQALEKSDGKEKFHEDSWEREGGGGGFTRVIQNGNIIEKGGVNFSAVYGPVSPVMKKSLSLEGTAFFATGVSIVIHPVSPMVPIIHMNVRYFELDSGKCWFGGGIDLTPHYVNPEDAVFFHKSLKDVCDRHNPGYYPDFKKWADDYFFIPHRNETRGIGGIFFDHLTETPGNNLRQRFDFVKDVGNAFAPVYTSLIEKNKDLPWGENEKNWQFLRRGRYAEFNLVYDRGTKFGLETHGRTESILMSLPPMAAWKYDFHPPDGTKESKTVQVLKKGLDWLS